MGEVMGEALKSDKNSITDYLLDQEKLNSGQFPKESQLGLPDTFDQILQEWGKVVLGRADYMNFL